VEPHLPDHPLAAPAAIGPGLYLHVPFCARRCHYCDFSSGGISAAAVERYLAAFERETAARAAHAAGVSFQSVFVGGGTPSALSARHFDRLWRAVRGSFSIDRDAEITLEANPESVGPRLLEAWAAAGVNRLSMGVQSFDDAELEALGRIHDSARPAAAFALARGHGFRRLSLDLMFGFPGHGAETWRRTLDRALALEPEHVSAYCFIPEAGTPLGDAARSGARPPLAHEAQADLYDTLTARMEERGYECYETSNFARSSEACRHNLVYWLRRDSLGLGPSAHGLWRGVREANFYSLERWAQALESNAAWAEREPETAASRAEEILMLGLRLGQGLDARAYAPEAWQELIERYGAAFDAAVAQGRLERRARGWRIAPRHRFVADDVIAWVATRASAAADLTLARAHP
jgi:oxygen-independent coproporphyrinogen III oxidase